MSRYLSIAIAIAFGTFGWAVPAGAGIIFDQGPPLVGGFNGPVAALSDSDGPYESADNFTLNAGADTITDVHWWGIYLLAKKPLTADDFTIRIFADAGGGSAATAPATAPAHEFAVGAVDRTLTGNKVDTVDVFEYWTAIPETTLAADTPYWLSIVNDTSADISPGNGDLNHWEWMFSSQTGNYSNRSIGTIDNSWNPFDGELAFRLTNDTVPGRVPEPATLALFAAGLLALGFLRRRRPARAATPPGGANRPRRPPGAAAPLTGRAVRVQPLGIPGLFPKIPSPPRGLSENLTPAGRGSGFSPCTITY